MTKRILLCLLVVLFVLTLILMGCGSGSRETSVQRGGIVRYAIWSAPTGVFHPHLYVVYYDSQVWNNIFSGLLRLNPQLEYEPDLAEKFEISEDNLTVTYTLRKGLKWHDGKPVTPDDIVYTFEMIADPDYTGPRYGEITAIAGVKEYHQGKADSIAGITVVDERTVSITTSEEYANALDLIGAKQIIPKHIWSEIPVALHKDQLELLRMPVGTGPFKINAFVENQYVELTANTDYHFGRPHLDGLMIQVSNQETAQDLLISGQLDFMMVSNMAGLMDAFETNNIPVDRIMGTGYQCMGFNNRLEIFSDKKVRQAFTHAIDRQGIVDNILNGNGVVANVPLAPFSWATPPQEKLNLYPYDKNRAIQLLQEAGWVYEDNIMYYKDEPVHLTLKYPVGDTNRERTAPLIQQNLKEIGIELVLKEMEFGNLIEEVVMQQDFELTLIGFDLGADPGELISFWHSDVAGSGGMNIMGFMNNKADSLLEEGQKHLRIKDRIQFYHDWTQMMNTEVPAAFLYNTIEGRAYNPSLKGLQLFPFSNFYDIHKWYIEK